jgi:heptaprenyl diphosphate synthase
MSGYERAKVKQVIKSRRDDVIIAALAALAITIHVAESALPSPLPGVKPGLANVITLVALMMFGWKTAAWVAALRVLVGSLFIGTFLSPAFMLSFSGALCSITLLGVAGHWTRKNWTRTNRARILKAKPGFSLAPSPVGLGVLAAMAHMTGQFYAAYWLFIPHKALFNVLPVLMTAALIFGIISGLIASSMVHYLNPEIIKHDSNQSVDFSSR